MPAKGGGCVFVCVLLLCVGAQSGPVNLSAYTVGAAAAKFPFHDQRQKSP